MFGRCLRQSAAILFFSFLSLWLTLIPGIANDDTTVVITSAGRLQGTHRSRGGAEFLGIPYAKAPIGNLRWHEPVELDTWPGVREATRFGAPCAQAVLGDWNRHDAETSKEDCLFLNVITPVWPPKAKLPVMFWIHGGANAGGTASSPLYKDGTLTEHGIVLVTVNYRLGIFGFLAHPELARESPHQTSGNYGLMDQIAALGWVRKNIAAFGGDPDNVTVFGQSAGAEDTSLLMISPQSKGLFQRAIVQSGSAFMPPVAPLAAAEKAGEALVAALGPPPGSKAVVFLRGLSEADLLRAATRQDRAAPPILGPILDGYVLTESPIDVFMAGREAPIPLLIGTTTREFGFTGPPDALRQFIQQFSGALAPRALELYGLANGGLGNDDPIYGSVGNQWMEDQIFRCPATTQAILHHSHKNSTFEYQLEHAIPGQEQQGAVHSADLPYVFGSYPKAGNISGSFNDLDFRIADLIERYWTNFAKTGDPSSGSDREWPEFGDAQRFVSITQDGRLVVNSGGLRRQQCDLSREILRSQKQSEHWRDFLPV
ncbi:MAG TPA: carboxylesterase family protein [Terriglobales bacterium]|nr:carboxylesterase family protein [Terriglobales bacterium]